MAGGRTCDECGIKLPMFVPRKRSEDGRLLCDGCHPDGKGAPGRPIGLHGSKDMTINAPTAAEVVASYRTDEWDGIEGELGDGTDYHLLCVKCGRGANVEIEIDGTWQPVCDNHARELGATDEDFAAVASMRAQAAMQTVAHDSGDSATIYHCPFCGSGQVTGGADGTVECDFCKTYFTVQVQPERAAFPQTVNGQPQQIPGMPGDATQPAPFGGAPTDTQGNDAFVPPDPAAAMDNALQGVPAFAPPGQGQPVTGARRRQSHDPEHPDGDDSLWCGMCDDYEGQPCEGGCGLKLCDRCKPDHYCPGPRKTSKTAADSYSCPWCSAKPGNPLDAPSGPAPSDCKCREFCGTDWCEWAMNSTSKRAFYLTEDGLLPEDAYIRHLAIKYADDREAVLAQVRNERNAR